MKILISTNAPWTPTGYGTQCAGIARGLRDMGQSVAIHGWWGLHGGPIEWEGIPVFPGHLDSYGNDSAIYYCRTWKADLLITLIDLWILNPDYGNMGSTKFCPLFPIDHADPIPPVIAQRFPLAHRLLVYSRYAEREVKAYDGGKYADKVRYIPHGIATDILRPCTPEEKRVFRRQLFKEEWPENAFIVGMVAANKGYPSRKNFPEVMEAFAGFWRAHPEARLYLHSQMGTEAQGPHLQEMAQHFGIEDVTRFANPTRLLAGDYTEEDMRRVYCCLDVLASPSAGEGFDLPLLEAQSCGIPVITTDHSAMAENVGAGWRIPAARLTYSLVQGQYADVHPEDIRHALEESHRRGNSEHWAHVVRHFALEYAWARVMTYWHDFLTEMDAGRRELAMELELAR